MIEETPKMGAGCPPPEKKFRKLIGSVRWVLSNTVWQGVIMRLNYRVT